MDAYKQVGVGLKRFGHWFEYIYTTAVIMAELHLSVRVDSTQFTYPMELVVLGREAYFEGETSDAQLLLPPADGYTLIKEFKTEVQFTGTPGNQTLKFTLPTTTAYTHFAVMYTKLHDRALKVHTSRAFLHPLDPAAVQRSALEGKFKILETAVINLAEKVACISSTLASNDEGSPGPHFDDPGENTRILHATLGLTVLAVMSLAVVAGLLLRKGDHIG